MRKRIAIGETFTVKLGSSVDVFRREEDDPTPLFDCERIRVTHLRCSVVANMIPYTFGTDSEWFAQRGLSV